MCTDNRRNKIRNLKEYGQREREEKSTWSVNDFDHSGAQVVYMVACYKYFWCLSLCVPWSFSRSWGCSKWLRRDCHRRNGFRPGGGASRKIPHFCKRFLSIGCMFSFYFLRVERSGNNFRSLCGSSSPPQKRLKVVDLGLLFTSSGWISGIWQQRASQSVAVYK